MRGVWFAILFTVFMSTKHLQSKTMLLIDIAHASVGVSVLVTAQNALPRMMASWRETFDHIDPATERMFATTLRVMRKLIEKANAAGFSAWDEIHCSIGSPWVLTHVRSLKYVKDKPFVVTQKLLRQVDDRNIERFFERTASGESPFSGQVILDHERVTTRVNGHVLEKPVGQRAREIESTYLISAIDPEHREAFRSSIFAVTHREPVMHAVQYMQWCAIRALKNANNYVLFDFHGGMGEAIVVRDGVPTVTATAPVSEQSYLSDVARGMGITSSELVSLLSLRAKGSLYSDYGERIIDAEKGMMDRYVQSMRSLLVAVAQHGLIPSHAFYVADAGSSFFEAVISSQEYAPLSLINDTLKPIHLSGALFSDTVDTHALVTPDSALLLLTLAVTHNNQ